MCVVYITIRMKGIVGSWLVDDFEDCINTYEGYSRPQLVRPNVGVCVIVLLDLEHFDALYMMLVR